MKINADFVPSTILEAVDRLVSALDEKDRDFIRAQDPASIHFGAGMGIRNAWSFWEWDTPIKRDAIETYKIAHADDMSGLLMAWVWARVREEPFDPFTYCNRFHEHWARAGMTSIEAGTPQR